MIKPEILSPAGNIEKLYAAVRFGADAVYLAGKRYGMRAGAGNFTADELDSAIKYAHNNGVKVYVTLNTMPRDDEYGELKKYILQLDEMKPDAYIVSDVGVMQTLHELCPDAVIHVSTQASVVSSKTADTYMRLFGVKRIVLARELSLCEIAKIRKNTSPELELETFVHGAMCVSYSGRCLLSNHFTGRDGNRGECAQPCRWNYKLFKLEESKDETRRPGIEQTEDGTFIMSSRDMCMIEHIPELCEAGISSFKIEGRMKSTYYTAATALAYRQAVDAYVKSPESYETDPLLVELLESVTHRKYDTGYYFDKPMSDAKIVDEPGYITERPYFGIVTGYDKESGYAQIRQKNKTVCGDKVRFLTPSGDTAPFRIEEILNEEKESVISTPHPKMLFYIKTPYPVGEGDILH